MVRSHAAWALGRIGGAEAVDALSDALRSEDDAEVRSEIEAALDDAGHPEAMVEIAR
jgi:epoxyqueuosine reductase